MEKAIIDAKENQMKKYFPLLAFTALLFVPMNAKADDIIPPDQLECMCQSICGTTSAWCVVPCELAYYFSLGIQ